MGKKASRRVYYVDNNFFHIDIKPSGRFSKEDLVRYKAGDDSESVPANLELLDSDDAIKADVLRELTMADLQQSPLAIKPPSSFLVDLLVSPKIATDYLANAEELYAERWAKHGPIKSRVIWYGQIVCLVASQWVDPLLSLIDKVRKLVGS